MSTAHRFSQGLDMASVEELHAKLATVIANQEHMESQLARLMSASEDMQTLRERLLLLEEQSRAHRDAAEKADRDADRTHWRAEAEKWFLRIGAALGVGGAGGSFFN